MTMANSPPVCMVVEDSVTGLTAALATSIPVPDF